MKFIFVFTVIFAAIMLMAAIRNKRNCHRLFGELERMKASVAKAENEKQILNERLAQVINIGGIGESTVLAIAGEIARMENNIYRMEDVPGRKQVSKSLDRIKVALQAEGYAVVPLLGTPYKEGMQMSAVFVLDENLPSGSSIITSVQKPQVNRNGKMIQAASVTVGQNN